MSALANYPHFVYRCYAADGGLLYIGCTSDLRARLAKHKHPSGAALGTPAASLYPLMARWVATRYPNRQSAFDAEKAAIRAERPALNLQGARV